MYEIATFYYFFLKKCEKIVDNATLCVLEYASKKAEVYFSPVEFRFGEVKNFRYYNF